MQTNFYVRKARVGENVYSAFETILSKTPALYRYTDIIPRTFLISTVVQSWCHKDVFTREPNQRFATNEAFLRAKSTKSFRFPKIQPEQHHNLSYWISCCRTPLQKEIVKKLHLNSLEASAYAQHGHGVPYNDNANNYILFLDLTCAKQASHDYHYPELTNGSISISVRFLTQLVNSEEVFFLGERSSIIYIGSSRNVSKNIFCNAKLETERWWIVAKFHYRLRSVGTWDIGSWGCSSQIHFLSHSATTLSFLWTLKTLMKKHWLLICDEDAVYLFRGHTPACVQES